MLTDTSFLFMLTLAQMVVILTRGIDLSVAANLGFGRHDLRACLARRIPELPIPAIIVMAIALGALLGAVNGALVAYIGIPPIVVTLGTLSIYRGAIFLIAGGAWLTSKDMSPAFLAFPKLSVLGRAHSHRHRCPGQPRVLDAARPHEARARALRGRRQPGRGALLRH